MYDHLPPRLARYLAAIYTGTSVPEIERQDIGSRLDAFAVALKHRTKLLRWNKQRGQKINQLNQRIHEQRLQMRELNRRLSFEKHRAEVFASLAVLWQKKFFKVSRWNNAHKREIAQLQAKLHDRRVEVKFLLRQLGDRNSLLQLKDKRIDELLDDIVTERRKVDALDKCVDTYDKLNDDLIRAVMRQDAELADWYEYVQLLIAKLDEKEKQLKLSNFEVGVGKKLLEKAQCNYYSVLDKYIDTRDKLFGLECEKERHGLHE